MSLEKIANLSKETRSLYNKLSDGKYHICINGKT